MARFFIDRPIFAYVLAVMVVIVGILSIRVLPIAQFPAIAPPAVSITANYPGADAQTLENTTTQIIEQQMKGIDNLRYFASTSDGSGNLAITLTFEQGTDPDIAQVQVQNKLQQATPLLPQEVQQAGLRVTKATANFLLIIAAYSENGDHDQVDLGDMIASKLQDPLSRIKGVGDTQVFGAQYSMRIWVDPFKMSNLGVTVTDITSALTAQNAQVSAGQVGSLPAVKGQSLNATVTAQSRLQTPEQFRAIIVRSATSGATGSRGMTGTYPRPGTVSRSAPSRTLRRASALAPSASSAARSSSSFFWRSSSEPSRRFSSSSRCSWTLLSLEERSR
jgi:HAE1 family hydrophobic/amphiphilic exporter-1/multidrug efflux pump